MWFQLLFGRLEPHTSAEIHALLSVSSIDYISASFPEWRPPDKVLSSKVNGRQFHVGSFSTPSLNELRTQALLLFSQHLSSAITSKGEETKRNTAKGRKWLRLNNFLSGDTLPLHARYPGALFQAASQFNCLEFPNPSTLPEAGVTAYAFDPTQGPACALACAAGTVYRNYFAPLPSNNDCPAQVGQSRDRQINTLDDLQESLSMKGKEGDKNIQKFYFSVKNGYTFGTESSLDQLNEIIPARDVACERALVGRDYRELLDLIKIGYHDNVGVTFSSRWTPSSSISIPSPHSSSTVSPITGERLVSQVYCAALSCSYSGLSNIDLWEPLARLVLDAAYEATLYAAVINRLTRKPFHGSANDLACCYSDQVFLTFLGGGVFGNKPEWIAEAIGRAVAIVEYNLMKIAETNYESIVTLETDPWLSVCLCYYREVEPKMSEHIERAYLLAKAKL